MRNHISERPTPLTYDYDTAAEYLGISRRRLERAVRSGLCERTKIGLHVSFSRAQLDRFVASAGGFHEATR